MIDTLTKKARNWLKKTGDAMIDGDLTLFRDPTLPLHAATKQYADSSSFFPVPIVGREYTSGWTFSATTHSWLSADIGTCLIAPWRVPVGTSWNRIRVRVGNASSSVHRLGIYNLSDVTWLPTSIALDAGTVAWLGLGQDNIVGISFTATQSLLGLAWLFESRSDAVNPAISMCAPAAAAAWPPGYNAAGANLALPEIMSLKSTGNAPGALPAVGTFSHVGTSDVSFVMPYLAMRRAA